MKKTITVMLAFLSVLLGCAAGRSGLSANAAYDNWKDAYADFLTESIVRGTVEDPTFSLIYLNDDEIPELVVSTKSMCHADSGELYTFYNGQIVDLDGYGSWGEFLYTEREGYIWSSYTGSGTTSQTIYQMEGAAVREIVSFEDNEGMELDTATYCVNDTPVSKEKFKASLKEWESKDWRSSGFDYYANSDNIDRVIRKADDKTTKPAEKTTKPVETKPSSGDPSVAAPLESGSAPDASAGSDEDAADVGIHGEDVTRKTEERDGERGQKPLVVYAAVSAVVIAALGAVLVILVLKGRKA